MINPILEFPGQPQDIRGFRPASINEEIAVALINGGIPDAQSPRPRLFEKEAGGRSLPVRRTGIFEESTGRFDSDSEIGYPAL